VALRLVCERELEIEAFVRQEYWTIEAVMNTGDGDQFSGPPSASTATNLAAWTSPTAIGRAIKAALAGARLSRIQCRGKPRRNPIPPFTTSTLQQEASRKLGFSSQRTMQVAQRLYEGVDIGGETVGLITYMRTDGVQILGEAIDRVSATMIGKEFTATLRLAERPRIQGEGQERPGGARGRPPDRFQPPAEGRLALPREGSGTALRTDLEAPVASQMASPNSNRPPSTSTAGSDGKTYGLRTTGTVVKFDGFLKLYEEGKDDSGRRSRPPPAAAGPRVTR
jgi:DNA topoisomerase-1